MRLIISAILFVINCSLAAILSAEKFPYTPEQLSLMRAVTEISVSPDGKETAFITDITGAFEVWTVALEGKGWPKQISNLGEQASNLRYSPDGKKLIFTSDYGGNERTDIYLVDAAGGIPENITSSTQAETGPRFSRDGRMIAYTFDPREEFLYELAVMDLNSRKVRQLTREPVNVHYPVWSPDAKTIAVTRSGDDQQGELFLVNVESAVKREIRPPVKGGIVFAEEFSPDGKKILCRAKNKKGFMQLYLLDIDSGKGVFLGPGEWDVEDVKWDSKAGIIFSANESGRSAVYRMAGPETKPEILIAPDGYIEEFDLDEAGLSLVYLRNDSRYPLDAWLFDLQKRQKKGWLTDSIAAGVDPEVLSKAELVNFKSFDGMVISAFYLKPKSYPLGNPPPALVYVHGGPNWQTLDAFDPLRQTLAEAGFAVIAPNYRGSTGYGKAFEDANNKDWGGGDLQDCVYAVRYLADKGEADIKRAGIFGRSYGGYMTLAALTMTPEAWAAGVEAYGMPDLIMDFDITGARFRDWYVTEMGTPKTHPQLFKDRSPVNFIDKIRAPLLIFQGANDTNVPKAESELIYSKINERGLPVEMIIYPDEGHGFTKRKNRTDYYRKTMEFFKRHLGPK
ncbi:MAG: S9 family peptidase [Elusimicrobia bacterium]|nr:S9 family peptidase [Elusimicrobiota bacterium]